MESIDRLLFGAGVAVTRFRFPGTGDRPLTAAVCGPRFQSTKRYEDGSAGGHGVIRPS